MALPRTLTAELFDETFAEHFLRNGCLFAIDQNRFLVGWGEWTKSDRAPETGCALFTPDFYLTDRTPWREPKHFTVVSRELFNLSVLSKLRSEVNLEALLEDQRFQWVEPSKEGFEQQVERIRKHFAEDRLQKAVPVVHAQAREIMTQDRLLAILTKLGESPTGLIPSGFWEEVEGLVGATPERLFAIRSSSLSTMALAGTRAKRSKDDAQALLDDPKERHEHQLVIDDLRERLSHFGAVSVGETHIAELPTLFHLKTSIEVTGVRATFAELAKALHPTPALGIAPRSFGFENMREWDDVTRRGRYGAPFGLSLRTDTDTIQDCLVAIRNVQWMGAKSPTLGSGCGIVRESEVEREWAELRLKRDSVKKVLNV